MTTTIRTPPADPESAALDLTVQAAETATGFRAVLQNLAGALHVEGVLSGLAWVDARLVATAVSFDACSAADPSDRCAVVPPWYAPAAARVAPTPRASPKRSASPRPCWNPCERARAATAPAGMGRHRRSIAPLRPARGARAARAFERRDHGGLRHRRSTTTKSGPLRWPRGSSTESARRSARVRIDHVRTVYKRTATGRGRGRCSGSFPSW